MQKKYYDTVAVKDESSLDSKLKLFFKNKNISFKDKIVNNQIAKVYDLSIKEVAFSYKKHKSFGFYRESEVVAVNKMLSFDMTVDYLLEDPDTYLEKSAHVVLYGEEEFEAFKRSNKNFQQTPRINSIIPVSNNRIKEKELLVFKNKDARCLFFPNIRKTGAATLAERIIVKKDGVALSLITDYNISLDELETFIPNTDSFGLLEQAYPVKQAGLFYISLNKRPEVGSVYTVEYDLDRDFYLDESKLIKLKNGSVVLDRSLHGSAGFIRPRVILRSGSRINNSSLIKKYKVLIEELEENIEESLLYEEFIEVSSRSTNNVI